MAKIIAGSSCKKLAHGLCKYLGLEYLDAQIERFADQELRVQLPTDLYGQEAVIVQSTCNPANDHLMELLLIVDAVKRSGARKVITVVPYFGYSRQDRPSYERGPISARLVARLLETAGVDQLITLDLHSKQSEGFFKIGVQNVDPMSLLIESYFHPLSSRDLGFLSRVSGLENLVPGIQTAPKTGSRLAADLGSLSAHQDQLASGMTTAMVNNLVIVSPDIGGLIRARKLSENLNSGLAIINKSRKEPNICHVDDIIGDVKGKHCLIVDDIADTAGTLCAAAFFLKELGALSVSTIVTHPVLSGDAVEKLEKAPIDKIITTDSIPQISLPTKFVVVDVVPAIGAAVKRLIS